MPAAFRHLAQYPGTGTSVEFRRKETKSVELWIDLDCGRMRVHYSWAGFQLAKNLHVAHYSDTRVGERSLI